MTQPERIPDSFKQLVENLIGRCQGYYAQVEQYRNDCIDGEISN